MSEASDRRIELEWPASDSFAAVGRLVLGGVAARCDFTYDRVDELGMALDALTQHHRPSDGRYVLQADLAADALAVTIGPFETDPLADDGVRRVVQALVGAVEVVPSTGSAGTSVRLTSPATAESR
jgi:hypothetical protein